MTDAVKAWYNAARRYPLLTQEQTLRIARKIQASEKGTKEHARWVNKLCLHNLRLAASVTHSYASGGRGLPWGGDQTADLLQVAFLGLRRAAERFDPSRGYTFSTYANAWIRQAVDQYHVENISVIRVPVSSAREIFYYKKHGHTKHEKDAEWVEKCALAATKAHGIRSYDAGLEALDGDCSLVDLLSEDNRLSPSKEDNHAYAPRIDIYKVMSALGLEHGIQEMIAAYIKRGNLDTVMMKRKCCNPQTRKVLRAAIRQIQDYSGVSQ